MTVDRTHWIVAMLVLFHLGMALGLWLHRAPAVDAKKACLALLEQISAPKSPAWQQ